MSYIGFRVKSLEFRVWCIVFSEEDRICLFSGDLIVIWSRSLFCLLKGDYDSGCGIVWVLVLY